MGSGGMVVMDEDTCMVDFARYFIDFVQRSPAGSAPPAGWAPGRCSTFSRTLPKARASPRTSTCCCNWPAAWAGSLCGLGQTAPNPVLTTLRYFRDEYEAHIQRNRCPAVVCREIISSPCQHVCPIETQAARLHRPFGGGAIPGGVCRDRRGQPVALGLRAGLPPPLRVELPGGEVGPADRRAGAEACGSGLCGQGGPLSCAERRQPEGPPVAIVGSGPAGLMAGYCLAKKGYRVTIFEALAVPGGALAVAIPEYRLPRDKLALDIENIQRAGVEIRTNSRIGKDIPFNELLSNYRAVFIACGPRSRASWG